ncbi:Hydroxycinnamoyl-CoA shikimate/quinate hydroxycinnamoyltransferase, partial [Thalictrum thalictroides]
PNGSSNFFDANVLKKALGRVLVPFYPIAGRLKKNNKGRIEFDCNDEGAIFVEAETDSVLDDLGDFVVSKQINQLLPFVDNTKDSYPLLSVQVTYFKCGGVSLGVTMEHSVADGTSGIYFTNSWARIARGLDIKVQPFIDRTLLRSRNPPTPCFTHIEHQPPPTMVAMAPSEKMLKLKQGSQPFTVSMFKLTSHQISLLKSQCNNASVRFSSFEVIAAHVWRCACKARCLQNDQESQISIAIDGRSRLSPALPSEYLGNAIFSITPMLTAGELLSKSLTDVVQTIHQTIVRADNEYLRSSIDYMEVLPELSGLLPNPAKANCPNLGFTSWCQLPMHEVDFGWGRPIFTGPGSILCEGLAYLFPSPKNDGILSLAIALQPDHMKLFRKYIYDDIKRGRESNL